MGEDQLSGARRRVPKIIHRNQEGNRCSTCDGTYEHVHGYDDLGEVPGKFDGSDWPPPTPTQETAAQ